MKFQLSTVKPMNNYQLYVLAAYTVTFAILGVMFTGSYSRYKKSKADFLNSTKKDS